MKTYLAAPDCGVTEFCSSEKNAYYTVLRANFPEQFANILRVETNTF